MSTIRTAADTIRASLDALPEAVRGTWEPNYGANAVHPTGAPTYHIARCRHARTTAYIATMASPDVAAALADLLEAQDAVQRAALSDRVLPPEWRQLLERRDRAIDALADAITRRGQQ